jgi:hypothetical protein
MMTVVEIGIANGGTSHAAVDNELAQYRCPEHGLIERRYGNGVQVWERVMCMEPRRSDWTPYCTKQARLERSVWSMGLGS